MSVVEPLARIHWTGIEAIERYHSIQHDFLRLQAVQ